MFEGRAVHTLFVDDALKAHIDPLLPDELAALEAAILADGCLVPLVAWDDVLIDGHNRYDICSRHQVPFEVLQKSFADLDEALVWMIDHQLARRNIDTYQRGVLGLKRKDIIARRGNQGARTDLLANLPKSDETPVKPGHNTRKEISEITGIKERTLANIEKIEAKAIAPVIAAVRNKTISIHAAAKLADLPAEQQRDLIAAGKKVVQAAAKEATKAKPRAKADKPAAPAGDWPFQSAEEKAAPAAPVAAQPSELEALQAEVADLKGRLADMADANQALLDDNDLMRKTFEADDQLAAAMTQVQHLDGLNRVLQGRVNGLMNEKAEFQRRYKAAKRDLEKLQKDFPRAA